MKVSAQFYPDLTTCPSCTSEATYLYTLGEHVVCSDCLAHYLVETEADVSLDLEHRVRQLEHSMDVLLQRPAKFKALELSLEYIKAERDAARVECARLQHELEQAHYHLTLAVTA